MNINVKEGLERKGEGGLDGPSSGHRMATTAAHPTGARVLTARDVTLKPGSALVSRHIQYNLLSI